MKALVFAENPAAAREFCTGAREQADNVVLVAFGDGVWTGMADTCFHIAVPECNILEDAYEVVNAIVDEQAPQIVIAESTVRVRALAGRVAAHLGTAVITDVMSFEDNAGMSLYFGGIAERSVRACGSISVYTASMGTFDAEGAHGSDELQEVVFQAPTLAVRRLGSEALPKVDVNLTGASTVVAAGRGFAQKEELDLARALCQKIDGELGCTRPLTEGVDWMPHEAYIGVSGLMLAPKVYVACGVSGQMQHMVGCNRSQTIFAINKDKNAPIFKQCDYGLIGNLENILPALTDVL